MGEVTIAGGGIIGLSTAYYLRQQGYEVTIVERGDITDGCSFGNMGYISPSHFVPLASPGIISEGLRHMLSSRSPFYIKPRLDADLIRWAYHFMRNSNQKNVTENAPNLNNILRLSRELMDDLKFDLGDVFDLEEKGCLMMCKSEDTLQHEFELAAQAEKFGLRVVCLQRNEVQDLEKNVETDVAGAVLFKDDCHFNPGKLMVALKELLIGKNVKFLTHTTITGMETRNEEVTALLTDKGKIEIKELVIATGSWIPALTAMLHQKLLLQPGKGYSYTYDFVQNNISYPAILVDGRCAITPWKNQLRIGGTMELSGINNKILGARMEGIYRSVKNFYPGLQISQPPADGIWSGLRPVTPDGLPYIGRMKKFTNVVVAGGHAMLGVSQATGTGKLVSQLIGHHTTAINMKAFRLDRF
ncbi:MAG: FAD-dependent oxidoreductase [Ferruginibacter sp.]